MRKMNTKRSSVSKKTFNSWWDRVLQITVDQLKSLISDEIEKHDLKKSKTEQPQTFTTEEKQTDSGKNNIYQFPENKIWFDTYEVWKDFDLSQVRELDFRDDMSIEWKVDFWMFKKLEYLDVSGCEELKKLINLSESMKQLICRMSWIESLDLKGCDNLETIDLYGCKSFEKIRNIPKNLISLLIAKTWYKWVLKGIDSLHQLRDLDISQCQNVIFINKLPKNLESFVAKWSSLDWKLNFKWSTKLNLIDIHNCKKLREILNIPKTLTKFLWWNSWLTWEISFEGCEDIEYIDLRWCSRLKKVIIPYSKIDCLKVDSTVKVIYSNKVNSH